MLPHKPIKSTKYFLYLKYSGLAFQMVAVVLVGIYLGRFLESFFGLNKPIIQLSLILLFFVAFIYKLYIQLQQDK